MERHLARVLNALEDHARHPEEEYVIAGLHHAGRVKVVVVGRLVGPAKRAEGPQPGREPRVEHVGVLVDIGAATLFAPGHLFRRIGGGEAVAVVAVPHGYTVAPPQLPRDVPVADVLHPVLRHDAYAAIKHGLYRGLGKRLHVDKPLVGHHWLQHGAAALTVGHAVGVRFHFEQVALAL